MNPRWASNRNVDASWELVKLGIPPEAVFQHEHAAAVTQEAGMPRSFPSVQRWELVYAGWVFESKGVGDAIEAVRRLREAGREVRLTVIGGGVVEPFKKQAKDAGLGEDFVMFAGRLPHAQTLYRVSEAGR